MRFPGLQENFIQTVVEGGVGELKLRALGLAKNPNALPEHRLQAYQTAAYGDEAALALFFESLGDLAPRQLPGVYSIVRTPKGE